MIPATNCCQYHWVENIDPRWNVPLVECAYCGSITVAEAIQFLKQPGTHFSGSDWKYNYPHKHYIEPVNPNAEAVVECGSKSGPEIDGNHEDDYWTCFAHGSTHGRLNAAPTKFPHCECPREERVTGYWSRAMMGTFPRMYTKFYTKHLVDATDVEFAEYNRLSVERFNVAWERDEKGLKWAAPHTDSFYGHQRWGAISQDGTVEHHDTKEYMEKQQQEREAELRREQGLPPEDGQA